MSFDDKERSVATAILARPDIAYVHIRSSTNNRFQRRIEQGSD